MCRCPSSAFSCERIRGTCTCCRLRSTSACDRIRDNSTPTDFYAAPARVIECVAPSPVTEHITPAPSVTHVTPSEQFSPAYTITGVPTGDSLDSTGLVNPQCAITTVEKQIVAREMTQNIVSTPVCAGDTGFDTRWARRCEVLRVGDRHNEGEIRVLHAGESPDNFRSGTWIPIHCFRPDGKRVCVHRCRGWW